MHVQQAQAFDEPSIEEKLKLLKADQSNIAKVISATISKPVQDVSNLIHNRTTLEPEKAQEIGLVTEIKSSLVPAGIPLVGIYDQQIQQQMMQFPIRGLTIEPQNAFSSISDSYTSI
ncbi:hypothetical protein CHS0354_000791 [Potamilus streckersoni]|uniref:Uncharacterized protein n=1 Tax=Potamilus streckersoni TaxID=2493646 RepID=A0AAE0T7B1_9BIVA|nr:hypothetical protein CHS0354_000791 [Potamilus streckersoni]